MRRRNLIMLILMAAAMTGRAQSESKYSPSTQMFLSEQRGEVQLPKANSKAPLTMTTLPLVGADEIAELKLINKRKIAEVEQVGGVDMISAFICVSNNNFTGIDFQHVAFKDASGNSRIVRAYTLSGTNSTSLTTHSTASAISALTYDTNDGDHGTHTCTTAGGSSVKVNGSTCRRFLS